MLFLAMVVAMVLLQSWGSGTPLHQDSWFNRWRMRVGSLGAMSGLQLALAVLVPVLLAHWLLALIKPLLFGLPWILAASALLLYAFGRGDFRQMHQRYCDQCRSGDFEGAYLRARSGLGWTGLTGEPRDQAAVHGMIQRAFLYEGYQRWFAPLFYFFLLGPAGALAYRLLQLSVEGAVTASAAHRCLFLVDWVPVRLLAAAFSVTGNFVGSSDELLAAAVDPEVDAGELLHSVATAAIDGGEPAPDSQDFGESAAQQNEAFTALLSRSAAAWIVAISLLVVLV